MSNLISVAAFVKRHCRMCREWPREALLDWLNWYRRKGWCAVIRDGEKIVGVGLARRLKDVGQFKEMYAHDDNGTVYWVEFVAAKSMKAVRVLWLLGLKRMRGCRLVAFQKEDNRAHVFGFGRLNRRLCHGWA